MTFGCVSGRLSRPLFGGWGEIMKILVLTLVLSVMGVSAALAGNCTYTSDRASDGSRCGDRASTVRPGGK